MAKPKLYEDDPYQKPTYLSKIPEKGRSYYVQAYPYPKAKPVGIITRQTNVLRAIINAIMRFGNRTQVKGVEVVKEKRNG